MKNVSDLPVGASVTVWARSGEPFEIRTIARRTERKLVDSKGVEWNARDGNQWGAASSGAWARGPWITPTADGDRDKIHAIKARSKAIELLDAARRRVLDSDFDEANSLNAALTAWLATEHQA